MANSSKCFSVFIFTGQSRISCEMERMGAKVSETLIVIRQQNDTFVQLSFRFIVMCYAVIYEDVLMLGSSRMF